MSPSKFSSVTSLITQQAFRLGTGHDGFTKAFARRLRCFDLATEGFRARVALPKILLDGLRISQVIANHSVYIRKAERVERLDDTLRGFSPLECVND